MRTIMIIGGKLQGVEAVYLAKKAGMYTIVVDRDQDVPAKKICDEFVCTNIFDREPVWLAAAAKADMVLPALENEVVLKWLVKWAAQMKIKMAFDMKAYEITSSKRRCEELFLEHDMPTPAAYPRCRAPYVVKPSDGSGSKGVRVFETEEEVEKFLAEAHPDEKYIVQEYVGGQGYSIEVIGKPGQYRTYQTMTINVDEDYDCCEVLAPSDLLPPVENVFRQLALKIAELIGLHGIMDVEIIEEDGMLKILEIDARIPSQTPITAFHSIGVNMVEELYTLFCEEEEWEKRADEPVPTDVKYVCYECIRFENGKMTRKGEHIIAETKGLSICEGLYEADDVIIDRPGTKQWSGIFINAAETQAKLMNKRDKMIKALEKQNG